MISRDTIEEVKNRMDIVDVIGEFVTLKRSGQNYKALSPFNNEKTPSFYVVPGKGIFKDFSSGKGGDAITFVMEHEGINYPEAIRHLAKKYGIEIKETVAPAGEKEETSLRESLFLVMAFAQKYFQTNLLETEDGRGIALAYLRERGFSDQTIEEFGLGFALNEWNRFQVTALASGYSEESIEKAGLIRKNEKSSYDYFRNRVIFPIHNIAGKVMAFGARTLQKDDKPKYLNSPETDIYHKSRSLYGLFQSKNKIRQTDMCYLVEGYTDVISLHQAGVKNVVAAGGTSLTTDQIVLIKRFTQNITVLFDGDAAGIKAALRGIDMVLSEGMNVRIVLFPDGHDPDSYSRAVSSSAFQEFLDKNARDFISFKAGLYINEAGSDPIRRAESIREIVGSIACIPDAIKRMVCIQECAQLLRLPEQILIAELNKMLLSNQRKGRHREETPPEEDVMLPPPPPEEPGIISKDDLIHIQERETIRLLLNYAESLLGEAKLAEYLFAELDDVSFTNPLYASMFQDMRSRWEAGQPVDGSYFLENGTPEVRNIVADLITPRYGTSNHWQDKYQIFFPKENELLESMASTHVLRLKFRFLQRIIQENLQRIKEAEQRGDDEQLELCLVQHQEYKNAERRLAELLGIVVAG